MNHPGSDLASLTSMINEPHLPRCILQDTSYLHQRDQTFGKVKRNNPSGGPPASIVASIYLVQTQQWLFHSWSKVNKQIHVSAGEKKDGPKCLQLYILCLSSTLENRSLLTFMATLNTQSGEVYKVRLRNALLKLLYRTPTEKFKFT